MADPNRNNFVKIGYSERKKDGLRRTHTALVNASAWTKVVERNIFMSQLRWPFDIDVNLRKYLYLLSKIKFLLF